MFLVVYLNFLLFCLFSLHAIGPNIALSHEVLNPELLY